MNFDKNVLIEWLPEEDTDSGESKVIERIIGALPGGETIVLIDIFDVNALPVLRSADDIKLAMEVGDLRVLTYDPLVPPTEIEEKHKKRRDSAFALVEAVIKETGEEFYLADVRGRAIARVEKETGKSRKVIYNYLRRYFQAGCKKNSLLPRYDKCGTGRTPLNGPYNDQDSSKLGRPSSLALATGENRGLRITEVHKKLMIKGLKKFYLMTDANSFEEAYDLTLDEYFNAGYRVENRVTKPIMKPANKVPSRKQFRYCYEKHFPDALANKKSRVGETKFNLLYRDLHGDSTASLSFGPRSVYMIDATIADVYLVSSFDSTKIIGRPVVYLIVDVFSRMIVGFSVSLEGPSWLGAMLALDNMVTDKVAFCAEFDIHVERWQWNCHSIPEAIFADRGEFEGYNADVLVDVLGITIHNTPPYRGDLKGIVERQFGIAKEKYVKFIPGAVKMRERGEKDHRLDATLTLNDFRAMMITNILDYNANHKLSWYRPDEFLVADNVPLKPLNLWNWGIQNRSGLLPSLPRDVARFALLPRKELTVTRFGIHFHKDIFYVPPPALKNRGKSNKVFAAYDPRSLDHIYLQSETTGEAVACPLTPASQLYLGRDWQEIKDRFAGVRQQDELDETRQIQTGADCRAQNKHIIKEAQERKQAQLAGIELSAAAQTKSIRSNREVERDMERHNNAFYLGDAVPPKQLAGIEASIPDTKQGYISAPDLTDEIDGILDEE